MNPLGLKTRREFLRTGMLGGSLCWTVPAFLQNTMLSLHAAADGQLIQGVTGKDGHILVVLQLAGGNDGLNTVIPFGDDDYRRARPTLALRENQVLKLGSKEKVGLHPALAGLAKSYEGGYLSVVQGVGYPNPNRSHFRSTEIWPPRRMRKSPPPPAGSADISTMPAPVATPPWASPWAPKPRKPLPPKLRKASSTRHGAPSDAGSVLTASRSRMVP